MALRHLLAAVAALLALSLSSPTLADAIQQSGALPNAVRSAGVTEAQWQLLQGRFTSLAHETNLRAGAIQNVAVEIFGAQRGLDFDAYVSLIVSGAHQLQTYLVDAQTRTDPNPASAMLRQRAVDAAEDGRLSEARELYDQLIAANRAARQRVRDQEDLSDAADMAEAGQIAYAAGDLLGAASRFNQAAELVPTSGTKSEVLWRYRLLQVDALRERASLFGEVEPLRQAIAICRDMLGDVATREEHSQGWAATQVELSRTLLAPLTLDLASARDAAAAARAALEVFTASDTPEQWATAQVSLTQALLTLGQLGEGVDNGVTVLHQAAQAANAALQVFTQAAAPDEWAEIELDLAQIQAELKHRGDGTENGGALVRGALPVLRAALERGDQTAEQRAILQAQIAQGLSSLGNEASLHESISLYRSSLQTLTAQNAPAYALLIQRGLASAFLDLYGSGDAAALNDAISSTRQALVLQRPDANAWGDDEATLGVELRLQAENGDIGALHEAVAAFQAALERTGPGQLQQKRRLALGFALLDLAQRSDQASPAAAAALFALVANDVNATQQQINAAQYGVQRVNALRTRRAEALVIAQASDANATAIGNPQTRTRDALIDLGVALKLRQGVLVEDNRRGRAEALRATIAQYPDDADIIADAQYYLGEELIYADSEVLEQATADDFAFVNPLATAGRQRELAAAAYQAALTHYTLDNHPREFARAHYMLAHIYEHMSQGADPQMLQRALEEAQLALQAYQAQNDTGNARYVQRDVEAYQDELHHLRETH